jgi:uncharacterized FlaG/YvyC family protein
MGQVTAVALGPLSAPEPQFRTVTAEARAQTKAIISAVQTINKAGLAGVNREVTYSKDSATRELVISVVDKQSKEVIVQWPSNYALEMAQDYRKEHPERDEPIF